MSDNNDRTGSFQPAVETPPPIQQQLIINLHAGGGISFVHPEDFRVFSMLLGNLIIRLPDLKFKEPSSIIKPPPGLVLKEGGK